MTALRIALPSAVTLLGLASGIAGVMLWPEPIALLLLAFGLACDLLDGHLARHLGAVTDFGRRLDWLTDVVVTACLVVRLYAPPAAVVFLVLFVPLWVAASERGWRLSGRFAVTGIAGLAVLARGVA